MREVGIYSTGFHVPSNVIKNEVIDERLKNVESGPAKGFKRSDLGIYESRFVSKGETTSDLAYFAAKKAIENAGIDPQEIDLIVYNTSSPDHVGSLDGYLLQDRLGLRKSAAITMVGGCSGFIYALIIGSKFIKDGTYNTVLVVAGEVVSVAGGIETDGKGVEVSGGINAGDGAGAVILKPLKEGKRGILATSMGGDGSGYDILIIPAGGMKMPASLETVEKGLHYTQFNDKKFSFSENQDDTISKLIAFSITAFSTALEEILSKTNKKVDDIDWMISHQPSAPVLNMLFDRFNINRNKVIMTLDRYACPWSASVPITLATGVEEGKLKKGQFITLIAFGGGLAYAGVALEWNDKEDFI